MRGDPPPDSPHHLPSVRSTPHARGSTLHLSIPQSFGAVYPACAGIHLTTGRLAYGHGGLPRMRGDPPSSNSFNISAFVSTPHARGSTLWL